MMTSICELAERRKPGWSLEQPFYTDPAVFERDINDVFRANWLFAGHACEIKEPGAYFCYEIAEDSLIIIRGRDDVIRALFNVCRHRGSRICKQPAGRHKHLVCPYHHWTYDTDGTLLRNTWMPEDFRKEDFSLARAHVRTVAGLIFICLAEEPPPFPAEDDLARLLECHGLTRAKLAYRETYDIKANWKLVIENQRECYHCAAKHKGYAAIQLDTDQQDPDKQDYLAIRRAESRDKWAALGIDVSIVNSAYAMTGASWRVNRAPFREGCVSETVDGQVVAPLMGDFTDPDVGNARANTYPNFWLHGSCDHMHTVRVTPIDATTTRLQADWLVHGEAKEGEDYDVQSLIAFSKRVNDEDHEIAGDQAKGVASSRYRPGPYSPTQEALVEHFVSWYVAHFTR